MRILFLGDIMGRAGREAVQGMAAKLRKDWALDFIIANGENATHGRGLSKAHAHALLEAGIDCLTLGDHAFDQKNMRSFITQNSAIIRPLNMEDDTPGNGAHVFSLKDGRTILVVQLLGTVFIKHPASNPFKTIAAALKNYPLGDKTNATVIDFHAEATSEKMAMGHWCDGRASAIIGTHTHVPTADAMILPKGTAYQSDAGMCGDYLSVIGMKKEEPINRFVTGKSKTAFEPAGGSATLCGVFVRTDDKTGKAQAICPVRINGALTPAAPSAAIIS